LRLEGLLRLKAEKVEVEAALQRIEALLNLKADQVFVVGEVRTLTDTKVDISVLMKLTERLEGLLALKAEKAEALKK